MKAFIRTLLTALALFVSVNASAKIIHLHNGRTTVNQDSLGKLDRQIDARYRVSTDCHMKMRTHTEYVVTIDGREIWGYTDRGTMWGDWLYEMDVKRGQIVRAFLDFTQEVPCEIWVFEPIGVNSPTGIDNVDAFAKREEETFDLSGRKVDYATAAPGIYIVNGKKVMKK